MARLLNILSQSHDPSSYHYKEKIWICYKSQNTVYWNKAYRKGSYAEPPILVISSVSRAGGVISLGDF